jgi:hypothetical protein
MVMAWIAYLIVGVIQMVATVSGIERLTGLPSFFRLGHLIFYRLDTDRGHCARDLRRAHGLAMGPVKRRFTFRRHPRLLSSARGNSNEIRWYCWCHG